MGRQCVEDRGEPFACLLGLKLKGQSPLMDGEGGALASARIVTVVRRPVTGSSKTSSDGSAVVA
jgi:hypothetical protein